MIINRLQTTRRFSTLSIVDVWRGYERMKQSGKIGYQPMFDIRLVPMSLKESLSVCWICQTVIHDEAHFTRKHSDLCYEDIRALMHIGRCIANRLQNPGSKDQFAKQNQPQKLMQNLGSKFKRKQSKRITNPSASVRQFNTLVTESNTFLDWLKLNEPIGRLATVSFDDLSLCRSDLEKGHNMYCICCGKWVMDRWTNHIIRKHSTLSQVEKLVIRLYSCRLKGFIISNVLLTRISNIKYCNRDENVFLDFLKDCHFILDTEPADLSTEGGMKKIIDKVKGAIIVKNTITNDDKIINYKQYTRTPEEPLLGGLCVIGYQNLFKQFGKKKDLGGFADARKYRLSNLNGKLRQELAIINPPNLDSVNFLEVLRGSTNAGHIILSYFKWSDRTITYYDGDLTVRQAPLKENIKKLSIAHYGHSNGTLRGGYSLGYMKQDLPFACAYLAIFASLLLMDGKDPAKYSMDYLKTFRITKYAIEDKGIKLRKFSLRKVVRLIAKKKKNVSTRKNKFEVIKE